MFLIVAKYLLPKGFRGLTVFPFIFMANGKDRENDVFLNHERIDIKKQLEMLILPFFIWYGIEFLIRLMQYKTQYKAYRNISFEREAYTCEVDLQYLKRRKIWSFVSYLREEKNNS